MIKSIYILLFVCFSLCASAQKLRCEQVRNYEQIDFAKYFSLKPNTFFQGDTVLSLSGLRATIFVPHKEKKEIDLGKLLSKSEEKLIQSSYSFHYFYSRDTLVIRNRKSVFLFSMKKGDFKLENVFAFKGKSGDKIYFHNNTIYFFGIYNHHPADDELSSGYLSYDLRSKEEKVFHFPFQAIVLTHLAPNRFMDFSEKSYAVCDPLKYKIYVFDLHNSVKDSLQAPDSLFRFNDLTAFTHRFDRQKIGAGIVNHLDDLRQYMDTLDRVWMINYINDSTLFVRLTRNSTRKEKQRQQFYDHLWVRKKQGWMLTEIKNIANPDPEKKMQKEDLWPFFLAASNYSCDRGTLYFTCWSTSPETLPQTLNELSGMNATKKDEIFLKVLQFKPTHE